MQVSTAQREISADPGTESRIVVKVVNTGSIIDGLSARLIGTGQAEVRAEPAMLPLFPESEGEFALAFDVPSSQPAGRHPLTVEVRSHTTGTVHHADVDLDVSARPGLRVVREPRTVRARRTGSFVLAISNDGNVPLEVTLAGVAGEAGTSVTLTPSVLRVEPGTASSVLAKVRGPRMVTGSEVDRTVGVEIVAREAVGAPRGGEGPVVEAEPVVAESTTLQLRQRPLISRGLLTFLILASVVLLWAAIFLFGLMNVFAGDPMTKTAPASFFANLASAETGSAGEDATGASDGSGEEDDAPPDALPKDGTLPPGVGGEVTGTVTARSDATPVGRILVEAFRTRADGKLVPVSSGATQSDGTYTLAGLFPTSYLIKFSAKGYDDVWYPNAPATRRARAVEAIAQGRTDGIDAVMRGRPATISGTVDPGDTVSPVPTTVTARLLSSAADTPAAATTTTDADGSYRLTGLAAPGTYELSFVAPGYGATTVVQQVAGGENRIQPTVLLSAGGGQISGVVRGDAGPLGGVTVTTTVGTTPVTVVTPTIGAVGAFTLQDLPTPGTYLVTFAAEGYGARTQVVDLEAGESATGVDLSLRAGVGSITGTVLGPGDAGLGGVEVVVGGAPTTEDGPPTTTTLTTAGAVGSFRFNDLPVPGSYTLTFTAAGFAPQTVPVTFDEEGQAEQVRVSLTTELGVLTGTVVDPDGDPDLIVGATVTATDGTTTYTTTSSGRGGALADGGYLLPDLPPGWYSVTASIEGRASQTALVRVTSGQTVRQRLELGDGRGAR